MGWLATGLGCPAQRAHPDVHNFKEWPYSQPSVVHPRSVFVPPYRTFAPLSHCACLPGAKKKHFSRFEVKIPLSSRS